MPRPTRKKEELIHFDGLITNETEKAWCVLHDDDTDWIPKSQCTDVDIRGDELTCKLPEWLAKEKGII